MSWEEFQSDLLERVKEELWAQWTALGVGSTDRFLPTRVDLEALLLGTWTFARTDPRLFDEALSWCCHFGALVNYKRLEKLLREQSDPKTHQVAQAWSDTVAKFGGTDWNLILNLPGEARSPESLFLTAELKPQSMVSTRDPTFEKWGLLRGPFTPRRNATTPDLSDPGLVQLFARRFIGGGCRSEVFALLLHGVEATTTELADMAVYSRRLVQEVLGDLNDAGVLDWDPSRGRTTRPTLRRAARDGFHMAMTGQASPRNWYGLYRQRDWPGFFLGLQALWLAVLRIKGANFGGFKAQSLLRDALEEATRYHGRTSLLAIYRPKMATDSIDGLLVETQLYLDSLFPEPLRVGGARHRL
jgi:hypothetical protein